MKKYTHRQLPAHSPRQPTPAPWRSRSEFSRSALAPVALTVGHGANSKAPRPSAEVCANSCHFDAPRSNQNAARTMSRSAKNQQLTCRTRHNER